MGYKKALVTIRTIDIHQGAVRDRLRDICFDRSLSEATQALVVGRWPLLFPMNQRSLDGLLMASLSWKRYSHRPGILPEEERGWEAEKKPSLCDAKRRHQAVIGAPPGC